MVRARKFWTEKLARIKADPSLCVSCGHPKDRENRKVCSKCVKRVVARHREVIEERAKVMQGETVEKLEAALRMIYQLQKEMSRLREATMKIKHHREMVYQQGHRAGKKTGIKLGVKASVKFQERVEASGREESLGEITRQELAAMSHAYDNAN